MTSTRRYGLLLRVGLFSLTLAAGLSIGLPAAHGQQLTLDFTQSGVDINSALANNSLNTVDVTSANSGQTETFDVWFVVTPGGSGQPNSNLGLEFAYWGARSSVTNGGAFTLPGGSGSGVSTGVGPSFTGSAYINSSSNPFYSLSAFYSNQFGDRTMDGVNDISSLTSKSGTLNAEAVETSMQLGNGNDGGEAITGGGWAWEVAAVKFVLPTIGASGTGTVTLNPGIPSFATNNTWTYTGGPAVSNSSNPTEPTQPGLGISFTDLGASPTPAISLSVPARQIAGSAVTLNGTVTNTGTGAYSFPTPTGGFTDNTGTGGTLTSFSQTSGTAGSVPATSGSINYTVLATATGAAGTTVTYNDTVNGSPTASTSPNDAVTDIVASRTISSTYTPSVTRFIYNASGITLGSASLSSTAAYTSATTATVGATTTAGSVNVGNGGAQSFNGTNTTGSINITTNGTAFTPGTQSLSVSLGDGTGLTGEGLTGEADSLSISGGTIDPVAMRSVTYTGTPINLGSGLYWNGLGTVGSSAPSGSAGLNGPGSDTTTTSVNVALSSSADANGIAGVSGTTGLFNGENVSGSRALGGTLTLAGIQGHSLIVGSNIVNGTISYAVTTAENNNNGLAGEGAYANVTVPYMYTTVGAGVIDGSGSGNFSGATAATAVIAPSGSYAGLAAQATGTSSAGGGVEHTVAQILMGTNSGTFTPVTESNPTGSANVGIMFRNRTTLETPGNDNVNAGFPMGTPMSPPLSNLPLISDVARLYGMNSSAMANPSSASPGAPIATDPFVFEMSYNPATLNAEGAFGNAEASRGNLYLASINASNIWVNTIDLNQTVEGSTTTLENGLVVGDSVTGNNFAKPFLESFATWESNNPNFNSNDIADYLGVWGVDTTNDQAWAIIDHNSDFAVVPEPSTIVLAAFGLLGAALFLRRKKTAAAA